VKKRDTWIASLASVALIGGSLALTSAAFAQSFSGSATGSVEERDFVARGRVTYFDVATSVRHSQSGWGGSGWSGGAGDNLLRLINTELTPNVVTPTGIEGESDCAMIYVFDDAQELEECCGCPISSNGMLTISTIDNLTSNPVNAGADLANGVIKVVAADENGSPTAKPFGVCDPANEYDLEPGVIEGWMTHVESTASNIGPGFGFVSTTGVHPLTEFSAFTFTLGRLANLCNANVANGTGVGVCSCGLGS
jgi:hypothetical protein